MNRNMGCLLVALLQACHLANYPAAGGRPVWRFLGYLQASDKFGYAGVLKCLRACKAEPSCKLLFCCFGIAGTHVAVRVGLNDPYRFLPMQNILWFPV